MVSGSNMKSRSISYAKYGYLFILPFFIIYAFFQIYPLFNTFYLSTQSNGSVITESVGTDNFRAILTGQGQKTDDNGNVYYAETRQAKAVRNDFFRVMKNTLILWFGNFIPQIIISLLLAAWFTDAYLKIKGKGFYKIVMYMPNIITAASVAALFVMLFSDSQFGAINKMLMNWGVDGAPYPFVTGKTQFISILFRHGCGSVIPPSCLCPVSWASILHSLRQQTLTELLLPSSSSSSLSLFLSLSCSIQWLHP